MTICTSTLYIIIDDVNGLHRKQYTHTHTSINIVHV